MTTEQKKMLKQYKANASPVLLEMINGIESNVKRWESCSEETILKDVDCIKRVNNKGYEWFNNQLVEIAKDIQFRRFGVV